MYFHIASTALKHFISHVVTFFWPELLTDCTVHIVFSLLIASEAEPETFGPFLVAFTTSFFFTTVLTTNTEFTFKISYRVFMAFQSKHRFERRVKTVEMVRRITGVANNYSLRLLRSR